MTRVVDWEAEYNVRLLHPDSKSFHALGRMESERTYRHFECRRDLRYGAGERALIDFFPVGQRFSREPVPLVAFFHGGYWHSHERQEFAFVARTFVRAGIATALVGYDLAPGVDMAGIVAQARSACHWLQAQATELGFDPDHVFTAGHSAGAHLAAAAMTEASDDPCVKGAVLVSGIYDLDPIRFTSLNEPLRLDARSARRHSPERHDPPASGDVLIAVGAFETSEFIRQSRAFGEHWRSKARTAELLVVPAAHHYSIVLELAEPESALSRAAVHRVQRTSALLARKSRARRR